MRSEFSIFFLTDGEAHVGNGVELLQAFFQKMSTEKGISSTMYCLGLSRDHDAVLLNKMAQCGSALGNFIYLDIYDGKYEKVTEAF